MNRFSIARRVGIVGIIGNVFLFFIKIFVGIFSKSQALIADSLNSAGDVFASFMTWIGNKISSVPNDEDHNYGHGKAEYIFSMLISLSMMLLSFKMLIDAVLSIFNKNKVIFSWVLIVVCLITIIVKMFLYFYTRCLYKKENNLLVKANMIDHRNDFIITVFTTLAILFSKFGIYFVDGIVGIGISIWIFLVGVKIFIESYNVLMDSAIDRTSKKNILNIIKANDNVKRIGTLYSISVGYQYVVVITIYVDGNLSTVDSHEIADKLEKDIISNVKNIKEVIAHVEPY